MLCTYHIVHIIISIANLNFHDLTVAALEPPIIAEKIIICDIVAILSSTKDKN